jgi:cystathionine gamma-synthase
MSARITTEFGQAVPPAPRHAVTVHMGAEWANAVKFGADAPSVVAKFKNTYPRTRPHRVIAQVSQTILAPLEKLGG